MNGAFRIGDHVTDTNGNRAVVDTVGPVPYKSTCADRIYQLSNGTARREHELRLTK
jgi:hypothetical protein